MFLIEPMRRVLEIARMFNGIEKDRLYFIAKKEYPNRNPNMDIDRLCRMKLISVEDGAVCVSDSAILPNMNEAVEIMIKFWNKNILGFEQGESPVLLKFTKLVKGKARTFYVCDAGNLSGLRIRGENAAVIVIADSQNYQVTQSLQKLQGLLDCEVITAVKEYGKYYFYKGEQK